jgi:hypothetical protein
MTSPPSRGAARRLEPGRQLGQLDLARAALAERELLEQAALDGAERPAVALAGPRRLATHTRPGGGSGPGEQRHAHEAAGLLGDVGGLVGVGELPALAGVGEDASVASAASTGASGGRRIGAGPRQRPRRGDRAPAASPGHRPEAAVAAQQQYQGDRSGSCHGGRGSITAGPRWRDSPLAPRGPQPAVLLRALLALVLTLSVLTAILYTGYLTYTDLSGRRCARPRPTPEVDRSGRA